MAASNQQYQRAGSFVQTTQVWDQAQLEQVNVNSEEFKKLLVRLYQNVNQIAVVLNTKSTGAYYQQEFVTGDLFFPPPADTLYSALPVAPVERQVSRKVVNFGRLPEMADGGGTGTLSIPHNLEIGPQWTFVKIYGCATNPSFFPPPPGVPAAIPPPRKAYIPLPYVDASTPSDPTKNLELYVDRLNVNITTGGFDYSPWTTTYVVIEWITV